MSDRDLDEPLLDDDYPIHPGYFYVADGAVVRSCFQGKVAVLKLQLGAKEVRRCDIAGRIKIMEETRT